MFENSCVSTKKHTNTYIFNGEDNYIIRLNELIRIPGAKLPW